MFCAHSLINQWCVLDGVLEFLETYEEQEVELKMKAFEAGEKKQQLEKELKEVWQLGVGYLLVTLVMSLSVLRGCVHAQVKANLTKLRPTVARSAEPIKQPVIGILLNVREQAAQVQLRVSYLVSNASWRPKYDVRVSSKERTMEVREELPRPPVVIICSLCRLATLVWYSRLQERTGRLTLPLHHK